MGMLDMFRFEHIISLCVVLISISMMFCCWYIQYTILPIIEAHDQNINTLIRLHMQKTVQMPMPTEPNIDSIPDLISVSDDSTTDSTTDSDGTDDVDDVETDDNTNVVALEIDEVDEVLEDEPVVEPIVDEPIVDEPIEIGRAHV